MRGAFGNELQLQDLPEQRISIFSGKEVALRHAPRRKGSENSGKVGSKTPEQWSGKNLLPVAGSKKKIKAQKDPIPTFEVWRKNKRKEKARLLSLRASGRQAPYSPLVPDAIPHHEKVQKGEEVTPAPPDMGMTPGMGAGETPGIPLGETPRMPGVETPMVGAETPFPFGGEETPRVPHTLEGHMEPWSKGEATPMLSTMGDQTPNVVPILPRRSDLKSKKDGATPLRPGEETPRVPHTPAAGSEGEPSSHQPTLDIPSEKKDEGQTPLVEGMTPMPQGETPLLGNLTPGVPSLAEGGETPMLPQGMDTPALPAMGNATPMLPQGMETPIMPPAELTRGMETPAMGMDTPTAPLRAVEAPATPPPGGSAAATVELTPMLEAGAQTPGTKAAEAVSSKSQDIEDL
jgi:hypothetical protein